MLKRHDFVKLRETSKLTQNRIQKRAVALGGTVTRGLRRGRVKGERWLLQSKNKRNRGDI